MADEIRYRVGAMTVTFTESDDGLHPFESAECECEEYTRLKTHPMVSGADEQCKHIRQAEMYHHYAERVSLVKEE